MSTHAVTMQSALSRAGFPSRAKGNSSSSSIKGFSRPLMPSPARRHTGPVVVRCIAEPVAASVSATKPKEAALKDGRTSADVLAAQPSFLKHIADHGAALPLTRHVIDTVQLNIGLYCNQACAHCHVDSSPMRTEMMTQETAERVMSLVSAHPSVRCIDLTGGAPELNRAFRYLVGEATRQGKEVIDRCNLTVLFEPGQEDLASFLAEHGVRIVASLPCYSPDNVDKQRGRGVFELSIEALQKLNAIGYGKEGSGLFLDLVYNPIGGSLPAPQANLEEAFKSELLQCYGIVFNSLFTITNMPVNRFADFLLRQGELEEYMQLLISAFNPASVANVMCRNLVNISWDGSVYDCDFNQQLNLEIPHLPSVGSASQQSSSSAAAAAEPSRRLSVFDLDSLDQLAQHRIATAAHCFGCTAGSGSSCTGTVV